MYINADMYINLGSYNVSNLGGLLRIQVLM